MALPQISPLAALFQITRLPDILTGAVFGASTTFSTIRQPSFPLQIHLRIH